LFSERLLGTNLSATSTPPASAQITIGSPNKLRGFYESGLSVAPNQNSVAAAMNFLNACKSLPATKGAGNSVCLGYVWTIGYKWHIQNNYNHFGPPNFISCHNGNESTQTWNAVDGVAPPSSHHPGGVNVAFGDGSVKFIKESINLTSWWAIGTRGGGEVVGADSF
jgi:prepilin-type processing-associated H-X9-DG protein